MRTTSVDFRGERVDIQYRDYGYEPDTNAHTVDWHFSDPVTGTDPEMTDAEAEAVYLQLIEMSYERGGDD